jgi:hypothetical protein
VRSLNLHEFFNFVTEQPSLKLQQMLSFYAFVGQLKNLSAGVAGRIHFLALRQPSNFHPGLIFCPAGKLGGLYDAPMGCFALSW